MSTVVPAMASFEELCTRSRVLIVAGKGGVGKTTATAAIASAAARNDMSVLIVEVESKSGLTELFRGGRAGASELTAVDEPVALDRRIEAMLVTPDRALLDYLDGNGLTRVSRRLLTTGTLEIVAASIPGMKDILVLGKVKQLERAGAADLIIVDGPAAGHALTFLGAARGLLDVARLGPIRKQAQDVDALLTDPARCRVVLVTWPEDLPVSEAIETGFALEDQTGVTLGPIIVNGVYPDRDLTVGAGDSPAVGEAATFWSRTRSTQCRQIERLAEALPLPQLHFPFRFTSDLDESDLAALTDAIVSVRSTAPKTTSSTLVRRGRAPR